MFHILQAVILGIVEGVTEFLPISSTGHLIIVNQFVAFTDKNFTFLFDIVIQLGAILAVVVYFWRRLWPFGTDPQKNRRVWSLWLKTIVGLVPALILGSLLEHFIKEKLFNPWTVATTMVLGGVIILLIERKERPAKVTTVPELGYKMAFLIGVIQCLAMIPGTSRSAATIIGAMLLGGSRVVATEFSFFLAIPTMVAASAYTLLKYFLPGEGPSDWVKAVLGLHHRVATHPGGLHGDQFVVLSVGFVVSFLVALVVTQFLINFVKGHNFKVFGWYRIALGAVIVAFFGWPLIVKCFHAF